MWTALEFNTFDQLQEWIDQFDGRTQWNEIFIKDGYGVEYKKLNQK
jgi:hypothetical protein